MPSVQIVGDYRYRGLYRTVTSNDRGYSLSPSSESLVDKAHIAAVKVF